MVTACTGLFRGIVTKRAPLDITMCLPSQTIRKPAFSKARTARRCGTPGTFGKSDRHVDFSCVGTRDGILNRRQILANCHLDIIEGLVFRSPFGPTARKSRTANTEAFVGLVQHDCVFHVRVP